MQPVYIYDAIRSARTRAKPEGGLRDLRPHDLLKGLYQHLEQRNGLDPANATQLHADAVFILLGAAIALVIGTRAARLRQFRTTLVFLGLLLSQGLIGAIQYATDLPIALVIAHMTGSALLVTGATWLVISFSRGSHETEL